MQNNDALGVPKIKRILAPTKEITRNLFERCFSHDAGVFGEEFNLTRSISFRCSDGNHDDRFLIRGTLQQEKLTVISNNTIIKISRRNSYFFFFNSC